jgi:hypothetical protein
MTVIKVGSRYRLRDNQVATVTREIGPGEEGYTEGYRFQGITDPYGQYDRVVIHVLMWTATGRQYPGSHPTNLDIVVIS